MVGYGDASRILQRSGIAPEDLNLSSDQDLLDLVEALNDQASGLVDQYCGRDYLLHADEEYEQLGTNSRDRLMLPGYPVLSVSSVINRGATLTPTDYVLREGPGVLLLRSGAAWGSAKLVYSWGYTSPPPGIVVAVEEMAVVALTGAAKNWITRGADSASMDGFSVSYTEVVGLMGLSPSIVQMLDRYRVATGA